MGVADSSGCLDVEPFEQASSRYQRVIARCMDTHSLLEPSGTTWVTAVSE